MAPRDPLLKDILASITTINESIQTLAKKTDDQAKILQDQNKANLEITKDLATKLDDIKENLDKSNEQLSNLEKKGTAQQTYIKELEAHIERLTNERRSHNLIIEGLPEDAYEDIRSKVNELFNDLGLSFTIDWCDSIYRLGPRRQATTRPRPVMVVFPFLRHKSKIFKNLHKLKTQDKWKRIYISDDLLVETERTLNSDVFMLLHGPKVLTAILGEPI